MAKLPKIFIPTITEDMLDPSIELGGGTSNPNIVAVTTEDALYDSENAGKYLEIQSDITLTANRALPSNATLKYGGGTINLSTYTLTGSNTKIIANYEDILIGASSGTLAGTWNAPIISIKNFGATQKGVEVFDAAITSGTSVVTSASSNFTSDNIGDFITINGASTSPAANSVLSGVITSINSTTSVNISVTANTTVTDAKCVYGFDNFNAITAATFVRNQSAGKLIWNTGDYYASAIARESYVINPPTGIVLGYSNNITWEGFDCNLRMIPHSLANSRFIRIYKTKNYSIHGINFYGDEFENPGISSKGEDNHIINFTTLAYNGQMYDVNIQGAHSDGLYGSGDTQFTNYIQGDSVATIQDSNVAFGFYDESGVFSASSDYAYSTTLLPLTGFQFDNSKYHGGLGFYTLTGGSFAGWSGLSEPYYWALYYDAEGNFIEKSPKLYIYDKVDITNENWKQIRILVKNPDNILDIDLRIRPDLIASGLILKNVNVSYCGREGASNLPLGTSWYDSDIHDIGGIPAGPGFAINVEDRRRSAKNYHFENIRTWNCWGSFKLVGTENVTITNCKLLTNTSNDINAAPTNPPHVGFDVAYGRNVIVSNNIIYYRRNTIDRGTLFVDNRMIGGTIAYTANNNVVKNNIFWETYLNSIYDSSRDREGYPTLFESNTFSYNQTNTGYFFRDNENAAIFNNNTFIFNDISNLANTATQADSFINFGENLTNRVFLRGNQTIELGGYWKNNIFKGARPLLSIRDYDSGNASFPLVDYYGDEIHNSMDFNQGLAKDFKLEKMKVYGWLEFDLNQWSNTLSTPNTISIIDTEVIIEDAEFNWTNAGSNILTTAAKNMNLYAKNTTFKIEPSFTRTSGSQKLMSLAHLGTTLFDNCTFDLTNMPSYNMDLTQTGNFAATLGAVTFLNCEFKNGMTVTLRAGDKMLYTYPDINCPLYADNATALSALGEGYWYKDSSTNEFKITYTP